MRKEMSRAAFWLPMMSFFTAFAFVACDTSRRDASEEMRDPDEEEAAGLGDENERLLVPEDTIHVTLTDFAIDMPRTLPAGPVAFHVMNEGSTAHNFEIEGQGEEEKLAESLPAGQSDILVMEMKPGTWEVYCPVADHEDKGMRLQVKVQ